MITKYKLDKNVLVIDINFLYDVGFQETNQDDIYKYVNLIIETKKIKFKGKKILIIVNGILLGTIYLTNYYLKKFNLKRKTTLINNLNSYYVPNLVTEI